MGPAKKSATDGAASPGTAVRLGTTAARYAACGVSTRDTGDLYAVRPHIAGRSITSARA